MAKVVKVGRLIHREHMTLMEIFAWNQQPEQIRDGWGHTYRHCHRLCKRSRLLGVEFLAKSHEQNILTTLLEWIEIKKESFIVGDMRAVIFCQKEIAKIRDDNFSKSMKGVTDYTGHYFNWEEISKDTDSQNAKVLA